MIEHEEIQGWPRLRVKIGFKLVNTWSIKNVPHEIMWSCGMVSFVNYDLWTNPSYVWYVYLCCLCDLGISRTYTWSSRCASRKISHSGVWGRNHEFWQSNNDQVRHSDLNGAWSIVIKIKRDTQGKGMALLDFNFTGLKVVVGRSGYRIDGCTMKRGFCLGNLIASS
jgi:hypothetical protein